MITAIVFILILGVLIFVHELGHFLTARRNGIKAEEFGFGFPPRLAGLVRDEKDGKYNFILGNKEIKSRNTVYSINWIPLGGFVRIKGEDGQNKDSDSFASKGAWTRIKVLAAGVVMNFILAWILISVGFMIGAPEAVDGNVIRDDSRIQISEIAKDSPAEEMGLKVGDEILKRQNNSVSFVNIAGFQEYVQSKKGQEIKLKIKRGGEVLELRGTPRLESPEGQGPLGVNLAQTVLQRYPWYQALWKGLVTVFNLMAMMLGVLVGIIKGLLVGKSVGADIAGPVGIAVLTKQVTTLGLVYVLQFAALLSINLGIINAFPFPALDGGRILFILIEKIKRSPVTPKTEQIFHTVGFVLLIILMVLITFRDVVKIIK